MVFEDLPLNLMALKDRVETTFKSAHSETKASVQIPRKSLRRGFCPTAKETSKDFELLKMALEKSFGQDKTFPTRKELRLAGLGNVEKALTAHGGAKEVMGHRSCFSNLKNGLKVGESSSVASSSVRWCESNHLQVACVQLV